MLRSILNSNQAALALQTPLKFLRFGAFSYPNPMRRFISLRYFSCSSPLSFCFAPICLSSIHVPVRKAQNFSLEIVFICGVSWKSVSGFRIPKTVGRGTRFCDKLIVNAFLPAIKRLPEEIAGNFEVLIWDSTVGADGSLALLLG